MKHVYAEIVREGDFIEYEKGDAPRLVHKPALTGRGKMMGAYCVCVLPDDSRHIEYMTKEEIDAIRARSKAKDEGPWVTDPEQMSIKTVVKRALKPFAASPEMSTAMEYDNQAIGLLQPASEARAPVSMPKEKPAAQAEAAPAASSGSSDQSTETVVDGNTVTGILEKVTCETKDKRDKSGKYTVYNAWVGRIKYSTFKDDLGKAATELEGKKVVLTIEANGKYMNFTGVKAAPSDKPQGQPEASATPSEGTEEASHEAPDAGDGDRSYFSEEGEASDRLAMVSIQDCADLETQIGPTKTALARKSIGMGKSMGLTDLDQEMLERLHKLYRAAL